MDARTIQSEFLVGAVAGMAGAGSLPGIYLGGSTSRALRERLLRTLLAAMLVPIGGKLIG